MSDSACVSRRRDSPRFSIKGEFQSLDHGELREQSAAYPFEIPYRLVNMYSVYGDTVLDPFWGTGTTTDAAMVAGRNSIGYELEEDFVNVFSDRVSEIPAVSREVIRKRLDEHEEFVEDRLASGEDFEYEAENYDFPVTTKQEKPMQFYAATEILPEDDGYTVVHEPVEGSGLQRTESNGETASLSDF